jgi:hypothetical protein
VSLPFAGLLLAALSVADPALPRDAVLQALPALDVFEMTLRGLPPPPSVIVRQTRYFGTVTIDHAAHLQRRSACVKCHGPGKVTKLEFTPKVAHERCIGCHIEEKAGPTKCTDCHVKSDPQQAAPTPKAIGAPPSAETTAVALATAGTRAPPSAPTRVPESVAPPAGLGDAMAAHRRLYRSIEVGFAAGSGLGGSVRVSSRQGGTLVVFGLDRLGGGGADGARTIGLIGAGIVQPLARGFSLDAVGLGGFDAVETPSTQLFPALGARVGVGWSRWRGPVDRIHLSLTGIVDANRRRLSEPGGKAAYSTLAVGFGLPK